MVAVLALLAALLLAAPAPASAQAAGPVTGAPVATTEAAAAGTYDVTCDGGYSEYYLPDSECAQAIADWQAAGCTVVWSNVPVGDDTDTLTVTCPPAHVVATVQELRDLTKDTVKKGKCTVGRDRVNGYLRIAGKFYQVGSAMMSTSFCYDGRTVYKAGTDDEPHHATISAPRVTSNIFMSCSYTGSLDNDFAYGWTDNTKALFYTTATFGFTCTGPALALGVSAGPAQVGVQVNNDKVYLTVTQYVRNDGVVTTVMGGRR